MLLEPLCAPTSCRHAPLKEETSLLRILNVTAFPCPARKRVSAYLTAPKWVARPLPRPIEGVADNRALTRSFRVENSRTKKSPHLIPQKVQCWRKLAVTVSISWLMQVALLPWLQFVGHDVVISKPNRVIGVLL